MTRRRGGEMKRIGLAVILVMVVTVGMAPIAGWGQEAPKRPKIWGIDHVRIYVSDPGKSQEFYSKLPGVRPKGDQCFEVAEPCFTIGWERNQSIELSKLPPGERKNWISEIGFATDDVEQMRRYLIAKGLSPSKISKQIYMKSPQYAHFELLDPEGNTISFVQRYGIPFDDPPFNAPWYVKILHAGFVVKDQKVESRFYEDVLGFRLYWKGGFKDDGLDWYEIQVPDGTDWIEYMLNIPANADHKELGVQNHFSLGVVSASAAAEYLRAHGQKEFDGPEIGRDGKNAIDVYDPDATRVELMEFVPTGKVCCMEYAGRHPRP